MFSITEITYKNHGSNYLSYDSAYRVTVAGSQMIMYPLGHGWECDGGHSIEFCTVKEFLEKYEIHSEVKLTLPLAAPSIDCVMEPDFASHGG